MADDDITPAPAYEETAGDGVARGSEPSSGTPSAAPVARRQSSKAIAALVCGLASFPVGLFIGPFAVPLSIAALVLGILARKEIAADPNVDGDGVALAGLIMGIIGIALTVIVIAVIALAFSTD